MTTSELAIQPHLPIRPPQTVAVSHQLALAHVNGQLVFFNAAGPIFSCAQNDPHGRRVAMGMFARLGLAEVGEIAQAFGVHRNTVGRHIKRFSSEGVAAAEPQKRGPKGPRKLLGSVLEEAQQLIDQGLPNLRVAVRLNLDEKTIRRALKDGRLRRMAAGVDGHSALKSASERNAEDASSNGGVAVKRHVERALARAGQLEEARPKFVAAEAVHAAGVLVALPAVVQEGLFEVGTKVYGKLRNGYFGLRSMLAVFVFMALLRIKCIEQLPSHAPGELGLLLGLDRAPETRTVRRKLREMGEQRLGVELKTALAQRWAGAAPARVGYLYVDGHVRPYNGHKHNLPKTHVPRRRLCMPATTEYWVNDAIGDPLLYVTAAANDGLLSMLDTTILPEVRALVGDERRTTIVFDREGWSPERFATWHEKGFDVLTYRKGKYDPWPAECFYEVRGRQLNGSNVTYRLGERSVLIRKGLWMREVRRLCADGHQTSVMTTRQDLSVFAVAERMFSRWRQENFFRYMRHEFDLDHVPTTAVEQADPGRLVPNPARKAMEKERSQVRTELAAAEREYGEAALANPESKRRTIRGFKIAHGKLGKRIKELRSRCAALSAELKITPKRIPISQLLADEDNVRLEQERKSITDAIKMVAYRAETELASLVRPLLPGREDEARKFLRDVFNLSGDLIPDESRQRLIIRLHAMASRRANQVLHALCDVMNETRTCYPGTTLRLAFEATPMHNDSLPSCPGV